MSIEDSKNRYEAILRDAWFLLENGGSLKYTTAQLLSLITTAMERLDKLDER